MGGSQYFGKEQYIQPNSGWVERWCYDAGGIGLGV